MCHNCSRVRETKSVAGQDSISRRADRVYRHVNSRRSLDRLPHNSDPALC